VFPFHFSSETMLQARHATVRAYVTVVSFVSCLLSSVGGFTPPIFVSWSAFCLCYKTLRPWSSWF
jgi:hypothetical protein